MMKRLRQIIEAVIARIGFRAPTVAGPEINTGAGGVLVNGKPAPGLAIHGFDVVAYFTDGMPKQGDAKFTMIHKGRLGASPRRPISKPSRRTPLSTNPPTEAIGSFRRRLLATPS